MAPKRMAMFALLRTCPLLASSFQLSAKRIAGSGGAARKFSSSSTTNNQSNGQNFLINVMEQMNDGAADWDNRIALQQRWSLEQKGWKVQVEWKMTPYGVGLFAAQDIAAETVLRIGQTGYNLLPFKSIQDIEAFCRKGKDEEEYLARLLYTKDYLWGYSPSGTDRRGYDLTPIDPENRFYGMWIPGNGLNHNSNPNTVYRTRKGGTDHQGIDLVAIDDIAKGEEMYDDYRRHGKAPQWLLKFAEKYQVTLNFAECNDFVDIKENSNSGQ